MSEEHTGWCLHCAAPFAAFGERNFLGFFQVVCPECGIATLAPLATGSRVAYWFFLFLLGAAFAMTWTLSFELRTRLAYAAILGVVAGVLVYDRALRRRGGGPAS